MRTRQLGVLKGNLVLLSFQIGQTKSFRLRQIRKSPRGGIPCQNCRRRHTRKTTRDGLPPWALVAVGAGAFVSLALVVILFLASGSTSTRPPEPAQPHGPLASEPQPDAAIRADDSTSGPATVSTAAYAADTAVAPATRPQAAGRPLPAIPAAVTRVPAGLGPDAPFDLETYFAAPPQDQNAAPLYLDALLEFDPGMAICFPQDSETESQEATRPGEIPTTARSISGRDE